MPAEEDSTLFLFDVGDIVYVKKDLRSVDIRLIDELKWSPGIALQMKNLQGKEVVITKRKRVFRSGKIYPAYYVGGNICIWSEEYFEAYKRKDCEVSTEEELYYMLMGTE